MPGPVPPIYGAGGVFTVTTSFRGLVDLLMSQRGIVRSTDWYRVAVFTAAALIGLASNAAAQFRPPAEPAVGEQYHVEVSYGWWNAEPSLLVNSESLGIPGTDVDLVEDLGIEKKNLGRLNVVLRPATKHKFRFEYLPIRYEASATVTREFVFNGQIYRVGLPVNTAADYLTYRVGYEYDFVYRSRGFFGVLFDLKYTDVNVELTSPIGVEFASAVAPIPTIGVVGRGYVAKNLAVGGEFSFFRLPGDFEDYDGKYTDWDIYSTVNFTNNVGATVGYRSVDVFYNSKLDTGALKFSGFHFTGVVRF
jgi:hypothetical protein